MIFHSDGGIEDWGYRFTAAAFINQNLKVPKHWIVSLDNQVAQTISTYVTSSLSCAPRNNSLEDSNSAWLEDKILIKPQLFQGTLGSSDIDKLLVDLIERPVNSLAEALVLIMKKRVPEDQGNYEVISRAVYATCACIIKYNGLGGEALQVAKGEMDVSEKLFKVWQTGQKIRHFFKQTTGTDEEVLINTSKEIITKALFLLRSETEEKSSYLTDDDMDSPLSLLSPDLLKKTYQEKPCQPSPRSPRFLKKTTEQQKVISVSERIIIFLQSNAKVSDLEAINKIRDV